MKSKKELLISELEDLDKDIKCLEAWIASDDWKRQCDEGTLSGTGGLRKLVVLKGWRESLARTIEALP